MIRTTWYKIRIGRNQKNAGRSAGKGAGGKRGAGRSAGKDSVPGRRDHNSSKALLKTEEDLLRKQVALTLSSSPHKLSSETEFHTVPVLGWELPFLACPDCLRKP